MDWTLQKVDRQQSLLGQQINQQDTTDLVCDYYHPPDLQEMADAARQAFPSDGSWDVLITFSTRRVAKRESLPDVFSLRTFPRRFD